MVRTTTTERIAELQRNPENIRNICILAHVDHGKTTLADTLIASNGIISQRMAGKLRYMDSREDEQMRGITMKCSTISLQYNTAAGSSYLVNLVDSPGHIDFTSEVSTAVRLCDGAVVLVDVVEGVCPQTHAVLRQAWAEGIRPVLVLNKMDRLISELKMTPAEAHLHLLQLLEQVNVITGELFSADVLEKIDKMDAEFEESDDSNLYFSPDQGNVVFASAIDGWGFGIERFAQIYAAKLDMNPSVLRKTLWGDFYLETKTKRIKKGAQAKGKKPLFVQFILDNLWAVYDAILVRRDKERIERIVLSLQLRIAARDTRHTDPRVHLQAICAQWLPLADAVLAMVVDKLPSARGMSEARVEKLLCSATRSFDSLPAESRRLKQAFLSCSSGEEAPVIIYVSKMVAVDKKLLPSKRPRPPTEAELLERHQLARQRHEAKMAASTTSTGATGEKTDQTEITHTSSDQSETQGPHTHTDYEEQTTSILQEESSQSEGCVADDDDDDDAFIAFARVFSGTVRRGRTLFVLGPKHDPSVITYKLSEISADGKNVEDLMHVTRFTVDDLYLFMGRELHKLEEVPAGNVLGIGGLQSHILKSATVASTLACPAFTDMFSDSVPILRVAVEPKHPVDLPRLLHGMQLLDQADPCVKIVVQETGEHVIMAAGEVHLQKCLDDLTTRYAKIAVHVSPPIVPFRETVVPTPQTDRVNEAITGAGSGQAADAASDGGVSVQPGGGAWRVTLVASPLPGDVTRLLADHCADLQTLHDCNSASRRSAAQEASCLSESARARLADLKARLGDAFAAAADEQWTDAVDRMWAFGPRRTGPNVLLGGRRLARRPSLWACLEGGGGGGTGGVVGTHDGGVVGGFQLATLAGPLCEEPLHGVCLTVTGCDDDDDDDGDSQGAVATSTGHVMACVRDGCRRALRAQPLRLMAAMYTCDIQATADVLGKLYAVIGRRNGRVLSEDLLEGTSAFNVNALLPVVDSFGFVDEIRKRTSGLASPQLRFSHWQLVDIDPFWVPTTEEEYMHFGEKADSENVAHRYMNDVRRRKGLKVDEKIVESGTKQRTLTKNK